MNVENLLKYFAWVANVSLNQTKFLYELCGNDFEKLMELQAKRRKHFPVGGCPNDKETVDEILKLEL